MLGPIVTFNRVVTGELAHDDVITTSTQPDPLLELEAITEFPDVVLSVILELLVHE
jgi:hypothetical protein